MLGEQLRKVRQARGLSVSEVARRAGIDRRHLGKIEGGEIPSPGVETVSRIARALGTSPEEFIVGGPVRPVQADPAPVQGESCLGVTVAGLYGGETGGAAQERTRGNGESLTIDECDQGKGVSAARVTRELGSDPDGIAYAVHKLLRGGYIEQASPGRYRLTLLGRTWLGE